MTLDAPKPLDSVRCPNGGKIAFGSRADAKVALLRMQRNNRMHERRNGGETLRTYECPYCGLWHVGRDKFVYTKMCPESLSASLRAYEARNRERRSP